MIWACGATQGMPAARAEALLARDPVPTWDYDRLSARDGGGDDAARRIDPDGARDLGRHAGRVGRKDGSLVDRPGGAGVCLPEFLDHLNIGGEVELRAAQSAWQRQMKHPCVRQCFGSRGSSRVASISSA